MGLHFVRCLREPSTSSWDEQTNPMDATSIAAWRAKNHMVVICGLSEKQLLPEGTM